MDKHACLTFPGSFSAFLCAQGPPRLPHNPSTLGVEAQGPGVQDHLWLHAKLRSACAT